MSLFAHTCTVCGHSDLQHIVRSRTSEVDCGHGGCPCKRLDAMGPSELIPTFDSDGRRVERVLRPGERFGGGMPSLSACACDECQLAYADLGLDGAA